MNGKEFELHLHDYLIPFWKNLLDEARHSFDFLTGHCIDKEYGGVYWSVAHDGRMCMEVMQRLNQK